VSGASPDRDYVLGTHDEEMERLGIQHRVWRDTVVQCWKWAGITSGSRVVDVGAGPGFATLDLAEIVGPSGNVVAVERSANFVRAASSASERRGLKQVRVHELDLMLDPIPARNMDFAWCRWVASFVPDRALLVERISACLRPGGRAIFHEYADYAAWRLAPPRPAHEEFVRRVIASWKEAGGEPDVAGEIVGHLSRAGFSIVRAEPRIFTARPGESLWLWPRSFIDVNVSRMVEIGKLDAELAERIRAEFQAAEDDPNSVLITPLVLEIVAERRSE
jgi:SAM-dependent methyltransferase